MKVFKSHGEILNKSTYPFFEKAVQLPFKKQVGLLKVTYTLSGENQLIKLVFGQFKRLGITPEDLQAACPSSKFIIVYREHLIDCYVSLLRVAATQEWHLDSRKSGADRSSPEKPLLYVDREKFLEFCQKTKLDYLECNFPALMEQAIIVDYQRLVSNPEQVFRDQVCPFLGLEFANPQTSLRKQITQPLSEVIENFNDLQETLYSADTVLKFEPGIGKFY
ncbi:MAG: hypothetical protein ACFBSC_20785 [Microcoleaceae cyanobacterium]